MLKKIGFGLLSIGVLFLAWHFFAKTYDYTISFKGDHGPGSVYYEVLRWEKLADDDTSSIEVIEQSPFSELKQKVRFGDTVLQFDWRLKRFNDSIVDISVGILDVENSFGQRLAALNFFKESSLSRKLKHQFSIFNMELDKRQQKYKVTQAGEKTSPDFPLCICVYAESTVTKKSRAMSGNVGFLNDFLSTTEVERAGNPFLEIKSWDHKTEALAFDFCFPIKNKTNIDLPPSMFYKSIQGRPSLYAIFNGNYSGSNLAWYDLIERAKAEGVQTTGFPLEVFNNNPQITGDDYNWTADVYLTLD